MTRRIEVIPQTMFFAPGQDSQYPGMGDAQKKLSRAARSVYNLADTIVARRTGKRNFVSRLSAEGTSEEQKRHAQVLIVTAGLATVAAINEQLGPQVLPEWTGANSLGENVAARIAGVISTPEAINMTIDREHVMNVQARKNPGAMAVIVGLSRQAIDGIAKAREVVVSNTYIVENKATISGRISGIEAAIIDAREAGAKLFRKLSIQNASHSPLMRIGAREYEKLLQGYSFENPQINLIMDAVNSVVKKGRRVQYNLAKALTTPVEIDKIIQLFMTAGGKHLIDIGPGEATSKDVERAKLPIDTIKMDRNFAGSLQELAKLAGK